MLMSEALPETATRSFAAYPKRNMSSTKPVSPIQSRAWEDLRREARKLESELDVKLAAFAKLCSGYETGYGSKGETGLAADQLSHSKAGEIEALLSRLSDVNEGMSSTLSGSTDARSHTLARHRDILHDFSQEFRRLTSALGAARERASLFSGASDSSASMMAGTSQAEAAMLLRERNTVQASNSAIDDVLSTAQAVSTSLTDQRRLFDNIGDKMVIMGSKFPVVNGLLNAIRRKKNRDTIILWGVVVVCTLFTLIYWWNK